MNSIAAEDHSIFVPFIVYVHTGNAYPELKHLEAGIVAKAMAALGPGGTKKNLKSSKACPTYLET